MKEKKQYFPLPTWNLEGQRVQPGALLFFFFFFIFFFIFRLLASWAQDLAFSFLTLSTKPSLSLPTITLSPLHRPGTGRRTEPRHERKHSETLTVIK